MDDRAQTPTGVATGRRPLLALVLVAAGLAGCSTIGGHFAGTDNRGAAASTLRGPAASTVEPAPVRSACPQVDSAGKALNINLPSGTVCHTGTNSQGSAYIIAVPPNWNGRLVLHSHGGPDLAVNPDRASEVLTRWSIMVRAGYALAGTAFRPGVAVSRAAEDTERLRGIFIRHIGKPSMTILHGQSWGAAVAAKAAELYTPATVGQRPFDAVLLSAGVLGGGTRSYDFRTDLRAVYQYLCNNHPRPSETPYDLNLGFPAGQSAPSNANLSARVNECLGLNLPREQRSLEQQRKIATITSVIKISEGNILGHLNWATRHFQDISQRHGGSPFGNTGAVYTGLSDAAAMAALNAGVPRFPAQAEAFRRFAQDADVNGRIAVPVLTVKWVRDPIAFVELDAYFKTLMTQAGAGERLVQTYAHSAESHSYISDAVFVTLMSALTQWVEKGQKPSAQSIAAACPSVAATFGSGVGCSFDPAYSPPALNSRVPDRQRPAP